LFFSVFSFQATHFWDKFETERQLKDGLWGGGGLMGTHRHWLIVLYVVGKGRH
jgi:hypothetical protein